MSSIFEMEIICNIINVFTVTFVQLNTSLLNKSITININSINIKVKVTDPKLLSSTV